MTYTEIANLARNPYELTPFGELRVSSPYTLFDLVNKYEVAANDLDTAVANGGAVAHVPAKSAVDLTVTGASGSYAKLRTKSYFRYQAGKSQRATLTVIHADGGVANQTRRWGYFDDSDGVFFELSGTTLRVVTRSSVSGSVVDTAVAQSNWGGDRCDGTGPSRMAVNIALGNIYEIQFQWLGVGSVLFFINGHLVHEAAFANTLSVPYMRTATLPLSWEIVNAAAAAPATMTCICASVKSESGQDPPALPFCAYNAADISVTTERPVLSIRPKATYNGIANRAVLQPYQMSVSNEAGRSSYRLVAGGTLTGAAFASVGATSMAEFDVAATALSGGETIAHIFLPNTIDARDVDIGQFVRTNQRGLRVTPLGGVQETWSVLATSEAAGATTVRAAISWIEIR